MVDLQISDFYECCYKPPDLRFNKREIQASFQRNFPLEMAVPTTKEQATKTTDNKKENDKGDWNTIEQKQNFLDFQRKIEDDLRGGETKQCNMSGFVIKKTTAFAVKDVYENILQKTFLQLIFFTLRTDRGCRHVSIACPLHVKNI